MVEAGLFDEVKSLLDCGYDENLQSMQGIGYKECVDFYMGRVSFDEAVENIKRETRHYAKKQMTWFKREKKVEFIDVGDFADTDAITDHILERIQKWA